MKSRIELNNTDITIRPSSLDSYVGCAYQWARVFLTGHVSIPNSRAVIGTGVHGGVEHMWTEVIETKDKEKINVPAAVDASVQRFKKEVEDYGINYSDGEDMNSCINEVVTGTTIYNDDVVPFAEIPMAVEIRLSLDLDHQIVKCLSGTVDYIAKNSLADTKTSKRSIVPQSYDIQQSIYKTLAEGNGYKINHSLIHGVVFTKKPYGEIKQLEPNIPKAKTIVNNLLDTLDVLATDVVKPEVLFRGNPKYYLCSPKYCAFYNDCIFVKGEDPEKKTAQVVKL